MTTFSEDWIRARVTRELADNGLDESALRSAPQLDGFERHFVLGPDKRGTLWTLEPAFVDGNQKLVLVAVRYHAAAAHLGNIVHGGAISAIVDGFAAACGILQLGWDIRAVTKEETVRFRSPLKLETPYLLVARPTSSPNDPRSVRVNTTIFGEDGRARIEADTVMVIPSRA